MNVVALDTDWGINLFFLKSIVGIFLRWQMPVCTQLRQEDGVLVSQDYVGEGEREVRVSVDYIMSCCLRTTKRHIIYRVGRVYTARITLLSLLSFIVESICKGGLSPVYCCLLTWGHGTLNAAQVRIIWKLHLGGNRQQLS